MTCAAQALTRDDAISAEQFGRALVKVRDRLTRSARRLTRNDVDGEDLVQDTMIRAWAARHQFQPGSNLVAWLMRIQRNLFITGRRREWRQILWEADAIERQRSPIRPRRRR